MKRKITAKEQYTTYASYPLVAGDVRAYEICLDLGEDVPGAEFKVTAIRADGKAIEDIGQIEGGIARYTMASNMYSAPGELVVRLAVLHDMSVLTDREIIFQVLESASGTEMAENTVTINDRVILRLGTLESKVAAKVDKVEGMGLSENDFSDEYKEKLDSLDETIGAQLERVSENVDNLSDALDGHKGSVTNPHNVTASQVGAYTKTETDTLLDKKADKSDISNVYSFKGTVENIEDVLIKYQLIPSGNPTVDGEIVGTYDSDGIYFKQNTVIPEGSTVKVPVRPVTLKPGEYHIGSILIEVNGASWASGLTITETTTITEVCFTIFSGGYTFEEDKVFGIDLFFNSIYVGNKSYNGAAEIGDVYNEASTGMNYAWTGNNWDPLGGEHKDLEARADIKNLQEQVGDFDSAIDTAIAVCDSYINGGA